MMTESQSLEALTFDEEEDYVIPPPQSQQLAIIATTSRPAIPALAANLSRNRPVHGATVSSSDGAQPIRRQEVVNGSSLKDNRVSSTKGFRLNAQVLFLTFPQCGTSKERAMENLKKLHPDLEWAIIAQEAHKDGTPHLHVVFRMVKKINIRQLDHFDAVAGKHGNYQGARNLKQVLKYVRKSDKEPLEQGPVPTATDMEASNSKTPQGEIIFEKLESGVDLRTIVMEHPSYSMMNLKKMKEMKTYLSMKTKKTTTKWVHSHSTSMETNDVVQWFRANLGVPRKFKQPQLWLWGPANTRKTSAVFKFMEITRTYIVPKEEFDDLYSDEDFDMAFLDEFSAGCRKVEFLKMFLQGGPCPIRQKGSQSMKTKDIPVVICSNYHPNELFTDYKELEAMKARLKIIGTQEPLDLDKITFEEIAEGEGPDDFICVQCARALGV